MNISEKVAYIKGLAEGLNCDDKIVTAILDVLGDIANAIGGIKEDQEYLENYIEEIDEDLGNLEEDYYECDCDCDCDDDDEDDDDDCDCCDCCDDETIEVECPGCGATVYLDEEIDPDCVECPACGAKFTCVCDCCDEDDDDCDCGCGCHDHD